MAQQPDPASETSYRRPSTFEAYRVKAFRFHQASWVTSSMAMQMAQLARPWLAFEVSDSALALGAVAASQGLAQVIAAPFGGLAADRFPKRALLTASQIVLLGMVTAMAAIVYFDIVEVWHLMVLAMVHGVTVTFNNPVRQAFVPFLLPRRLLANGIALHNGARNFNQIVGPAVVGVLLDIRISIAFFVIVGLHAASVALSTRLPYVPPEGSNGRSVGADLLFGLRYVAGHRHLRVIVLLSILATIFAHPYHTLLPVFQQDVLEVSETALGMMFAATGLGALVASLLVATFSGWSVKASSQLVSGVAFGIAVAAFAMSPSFPLSLLMLFLAGGANQAFGVANNTQMIYHADPSLYGRVTGLGIWVRALMFMSVLGYGAAIDAFGAPVIIFAGATLFVLGVLLVTVSFRWFWRNATPPR